MTIQATAKRWKGLQAVSVVFVIFGTIMAAGSGSGAGVFLMMLGLAGFIYARFGAWWHHG